jgi:hypothetical protein
MAIVKILLFATLRERAQTVTSGYLTDKRIKRAVSAYPLPHPLVIIRERELPNFGCNVNHQNKTGAI